MKEFQFIFKGNIFFGNGSRKQLKNIISDNNYKNVCFIIDQGLINLRIIEEFLNTISIHKIIVKCDISEPTYDKLEEKRISHSDQIIDAFIGIGGGSALDMAKALSVLYSNEKPALSYRGFNLFDGPIKPIIAMPTTAGTGSEITPNASFIDSNEKKKMGINGELIRPAYAILDPELTLSCPLKPTISAAVDSLVHSSEAFAAKKTNPMAKFFAIEGFNIVFDNLYDLTNDLENIELRGKIMYGAFLSGIALMNSGTGPAAAMSYPLGVHYGVPHGIGGGIFLPHVIEYNISNGFFEYAHLMNSAHKNKKESSFNLVESMFKLWHDIDVPQDLTKFGLTNDKIEFFIKDTMDLKPALDQNPISFYENEIELILNKLMTNK